MKSERARVCEGERKAGGDGGEKKNISRQMFPMELLKERRRAN